MQDRLFPTIQYPHLSPRTNFLQPESGATTCIDMTCCGQTKRLDTTTPPNVPSRSCILPRSTSRVDHITRHSLLLGRCIPLLTLASATPTVTPSFLPAFPPSPREVSSWVAMSNLTLLRFVLAVTPDAAVTAEIPEMSEYRLSRFETSFIPRPEALPFLDRFGGTARSAWPAGVTGNGTGICECDMDRLSAEPSQNVDTVLSQAGWHTSPQS